MKRKNIMIIIGIIIIIGVILFIPLKVYENKLMKQLEEECSKEFDVDGTPFPIPNINKETRTEDGQFSFECCKTEEKNICLSIGLIEPNILFDKLENLRGEEVVS